MKLKKLVLENFRCYSEIEIDFHERLTVIVGDNGKGKTSILDGIALLLGRFVTRLPGVSGIGASHADIRIIANRKIAPAFRCYLEVDTSTELAVLNEPIPDGGALVRWSLSRTRDKSPRTKEEALKSMRRDIVLAWKQIDAFADRLVDANAVSKRYLMPLIAYYGTNRAVFETPLRRRNFKTEFARFDSLAGALGTAANFKRVFEWFHAKENEEAREQKKRQSFEYEDHELKAVRRAISIFFPEFHNPRTELRPLRFVVDREINEGTFVTFDLNQLSDGYRTTLAMIVDLASRMAEANPPEESGVDPLDTEAIVLIDEVDLHLHPAWQQKILLQLQQVFPKAQFVVTTHSPQVLTTVESECIRELVWDDGNVEIRMPEFSLGAESPMLLQSIQGVNPRPQFLPIVKKLNRYIELVQLNKWNTEEAVSLRNELDAWGHGYESTLTKADMDIRLRSIRQSQHEKNK